MPPEAVETIESIRDRVARARLAGLRVGLVPTMGALHAGHARLIESARAECSTVVVSIFVNPTQFGPNEDYSRYPRAFEADLALCERAGADLVFRPDVATMYPPGPPSAYVEVPGLSSVLEGASRPGHFRGVATVVLKLFGIVAPDVAYFGQKDYQQQLVLRRMVADLNVPVAVATVPTVREPDGLALSSRNRYLGPDERRAATVLWRALGSADAAVRDGERSGRRVRQILSGTIESEPLASLDYAEVADAETLEPLDELDPGRRSVALLAARVGPARLIDNAILPPRIVALTQSPTPTPRGRSVYQILFQIPGLKVKVFGFGLMLMLALMASMGLAGWRAKRVRLSDDMVYDLAIWVLLGGLVGARIFFVIEYWRTFDNWWQVFQIWNGGIVLYGSILGGAVAVLLYRKVRPFPLRPMMDVIAPALAIGIAIGRIGCFLNGCCWGDRCDLPWAVTFPAESSPWNDQVRHGLIDVSQARSLPIHPTQLYSSIDGFLLLFLLTAYYPLRTRDGEVMALLAVTYPITRFLIERLRNDEAGSIGGFTVSQAISLGLFAIGVAYWLYLRTLPAGRYAEAAPDPADV